MNRAELWRCAERLFEEALRLPESERLGLLDPHRISNPELHALVRDMLAESSVDQWVGEQRSVEEAGATTSESVGDGLVADSSGIPKSIGRYEIVREIGRGGMGIVYEARQPRPHRSVALKVLRSAELGSASSATRDSHLRGLRRFLEEAEVLGRLDHPGIVPILELDETDSGVAYFTMRLVTGEDLRAVITRIREGADGWSIARGLGVLQRVCDVLAFAHHRGVVHRDLKPSNVMVGAFGEVYVIDWGLARVAGRGDASDSTTREDRTAAESVLGTAMGDVFGTPAYMSPEQARGDLRSMGPRSDVYSVGAMLYELLVGTPPNWSSSEPNDPVSLLARVRNRPRPSLATDESVAPMLAAIVDKATAFDPSDRYATMDELGSDIEAFLENRLVHAWRNGPMAELRMWCVRNRGVAIAAAIAASVVIASALFLALLSRSLARERDDVFRLSAARDVARLRSEIDSLWPIDASKAASMEGWLSRAAELVGDLPQHRERRESLRARALPWTSEEKDRDRETHPAAAELAVARATLAKIPTELEFVESHIRPDSDDAQVREVSAVLERARTMLLERRSRCEELIPRLESLVETRRTYRFESDSDAWWHEQLELLVSELESLADPESGAIDGFSEQHGPGVRRRLELARSLADTTIDGERARRIWSAAIEEIADPSTSPAYLGLRIEPQLGLLPLGRDRASGLFEFWHPLSGTEPERAEDGSLRMDRESSLVFVLIPGGRYLMGAQSDDPNARNHDPKARDDEGPVHEVEVAPFFMSKYEMTASQWERVAGRDPSVNREWSSYAYGLSTNLPVENVRFDLAKEMLHRLSLELPTEEQWEYACRGGTATSWWCGDDPSDLVGRVNLADRTFDESQVSTANACDDAFDDGYPVEAPVGSLPANGFGLHECAGNVFEWCAGEYTEWGYSSPEQSSTEHAGTPRVARGGSFGSLPDELRSADRMPATAIEQAGLMFFGVRPCRNIVESSVSQSK